MALRKKRWHLVAELRQLGYKIELAPLDPQPAPGAKV
jgi:hypothetical protein